MVQNHIQEGATGENGWTVFCNSKTASRIRSCIHICIACVCIYVLFTYNVLKGEKSENAETWNQPPINLIIDKFVCMCDELLCYHAHEQTKYTYHIYIYLTY